MLSAAHWRPAPWLVALVLPLVAGCSLRGTDDLQSGNPPDPADECGAGRAMCGGDCVDILASEEHCGVCNEPCATGSCEQGSCLRLAGSFAGTSLEAGSDQYLFLAESQHCSNQLRYFADDEDPTLQNLTAPDLRLVDGVTTTGGGDVYFTAVRLVSQGESPLEVFHFDPATGDYPRRWSEMDPQLRDLSKPIYAPLAYFNSQLLWAGSEGLFSGRPDSLDADGLIASPSVLVPGAAQIRRIEWGSDDTRLWLDESGLHAKFKGEVVVDVATDVVDFAVEGTSVVWAETNGDIRVVTDPANSGDATTVASGESVGHIAITVESVYWTAPDTPGTLKRVSRQEGPVETLLTVPEWAFGALATTGNRIYWSANRVDEAGGPACDAGRVYRRRLTAPPPP